MIEEDTLRRNIVHTLYQQTFLMKNIWQIVHKSEKINRLDIYFPEQSSI